MKLRILACLFVVLSFSINDTIAQYKIKRYDAIVRLTNGRRFKGLLETVNDGGVTIRFHRESKFLAADSIQTIRIKHYNAQNKHLLVGGLLGLAGGLTIYKIQHDNGNVQPIILPVVIVSSTLAGAAVSATINALTSVEKFENVNQSGQFKQIKDDLKRYSLSR